MRVRLLTLVAAVVVFPSFLHAAPTYTWGHSYGNEAEQSLSAVAIDPFGNILLCGSFYGSITFATTMNSAGNSDLFVAKLDPAGVPLWNRRVGFFPPDLGLDVTSDPVGNVIVVGQGGVTPKLLMAKFAPDGTQHWVKFLGPNGHRGQMVATNAAKEIIVAGDTAGNRGFLAKFDQAGDSLWTKEIENYFGSSSPKGLEIDALGQIVMFGQFTDSLIIDDAGLRSKGSTDLFLAKFTTHGVRLWSHSYGSTGTEVAGCFALSESGRPAFTASLYQAVDFGGGNITPTGYPEPCVAVFTPAGTHLWSKRVASTAHAYANSMVFTQNSDLLISCYGTGTLDFGGGPVDGVGAAYNTYVARLFQDTGAHRWSTVFHGDGDLFSSVEETQGDLILAGTMWGAVNLGGGALPFAGESDVFAARFNEVLTAAGGPLAFGSLEQNVPNPFNPATTIRYTLDAPAHVAIQIYNASGQTVRRLDDGARSAGPHSVTWDGRNNAGLPVASGVYFYRLEGAPGSPARKMTLLK